MFNFLKFFKRKKLSLKLKVKFIKLMKLVMMINTFF